MNTRVQKNSYKRWNAACIKISPSSDFIISVKIIFKKYFHLSFTYAIQTRFRYCCHNGKLFLKKTDSDKEKKIQEEYKSTLTIYVIWALRKVG